MGASRLRLADGIVHIDPRKRIGSFYICQRFITIAVAHVGDILAFDAGSQVELLHRIEVDGDHPLRTLGDALTWLDMVAPDIDVLEIAVSGRFLSLAEKDAPVADRYARWAAGPNEPVWWNSDIYQFVLAYFQNRAEEKCVPQPIVRISTDTKSAATWESHYESIRDTANGRGPILTIRNCSFSDVSDGMDSGLSALALRDCATMLLPAAVFRSGDYRGCRDWFPGKLRGLKPNAPQEATFDQLTNVAAVEKRAFFLGRSQKRVSFADIVMDDRSPFEKDALMAPATYVGMMARLLFERVDNIKAIVPHGQVATGDGSQEYRDAYLETARTSFDYYGKFARLGRYQLAKKAPPAEELLRIRSHPNLVTVGALLRGAKRLVPS
nr:hypothetical protein [uncultured Hyphomonas sp.]